MDFTQKILYIQLHVNNIKNKKTAGKTAGIEKITF